MSNEEKERDKLHSELKLLNKILSTLIDGKTRRKQAGSLAGVERDFIDVVLDAAGALTVVYNREGQILCFNRACEEATGFSSKEVIGKYVWDLSPTEEDAQEVREEFRRLRVGQSANRFETFWLEKGGSKRLITWENTVLSEAKSKEGYVIGIGIDITGHRKLEKNLRESEEKYRRLVETANDAIFIADAETGIILDVNEKAVEILGMPREKIIGLHQHKLHPREEALKYRAIFEEAVREGRGNYNDLTVLQSDGGRLSVDISASVTEIGGKKIIQGIFRDIREKKQAEKAIRESEERLNSFFIDAPAGLVIIDSDLKFKKINEKLACIHGIDVEKHRGKTIQEVLPELSRQIVPLCRTVLEENKPVMNVEISGETPAQPGVVRHFIASTFPIPGPGERPAEVGCIVVEITERKRSEELLSWKAQANAALAELAGAIIEPRPIEEISSLALNYTKELTESVSGFVAFVDPQTKSLIAPSMTSDIYGSCLLAGRNLKCRESSGLCGWVVENKKPVLSNRTSEGPRGPGALPCHLPIERFLSAPAMVGERLVGVISVANSRRDYTDRDLKIIRQVATIYAIAV